MNKIFYIFIMIFSISSCKEDCKTETYEQEISVQILQKEKSFYKIEYDLNGVKYMQLVDTSKVKINTQKSGLILIKYEAFNCNEDFIINPSSTELVTLYSFY